MASAKSSADNMNLKEITVNQFINEVVAHLEAGNLQPLVGIGPSGIGKTESIIKTIQNLDVHYEDDDGNIQVTTGGVKVTEVRLSIYEETDIVGLPMVDKDGKTAHAESNIWPDSNYDKPCIILLDEVTSAPKGMRTACYQLMDESRKLGTYKLPKRALIVACGNGPNDGGDFRGMEKAFLSRAAAYRVVSNFSEWKEWAKANNIHPIIISYLELKPEDLNTIDVSANPTDIMACPRSWVALSKNLTNLENRLVAKKKGGLSDRDRMEIANAVKKDPRFRTPDERKEEIKRRIRNLQSENADAFKIVIEDSQSLLITACGCVGQAVGDAFATFYKHAEHAVNVYDILNGKAVPKKRDGTIDLDNCKPFGDYNGDNIGEIAVIVSNSIYAVLKREYDALVKSDKEKYTINSLVDDEEVTKKVFLDFDQGFVEHILNALDWIQTMKRGLANRQVSQSVVALGDLQTHILASLVGQFDFLRSLCMLISSEDDVPELNVKGLKKEDINRYNSNYRRFIKLVDWLISKARF